MILYILLFIVNRVLAGICPFTSKIGSVLSWLSIVAVWVLMALTVFLAPHWWYGLVVVGLYFIVPLLLPRINPGAMSDKARIVSDIGSDINIAITVVLYLMLFGVINKTQ